uniref:Uncharacterized protein n=1 Tax=Bombyx mori TaxID=7091 RepID=A0A8R2M6C5_BOMMO|nr:uncharacterized protein LOC101743640 [Bombyx mori]
MLPMKHEFTTKYRKIRSQGSIHIQRALNFDDLNEAVRLHRSQRMSSKAFWKVVPKDSCEVYRARKKRQLEKERKIQIEKRESNHRKEKKIEKKLSKRKDSKRKQRKATRRRTKRRKCCRSVTVSLDSGISLCTSCRHMDYE